jgi:hypothetical protein
MVTLFEKRYDKFNKKILNTSISKYFGITDPNLSFKLIRKNNDDELYFNVLYFKPQEYFNFKNVPKEINDIINSYLNDYVDMQININYMNDYPFNCPNWSLLSFSSNITSDWELNDIFSYLINCHHRQLNRDWSPATDIEKDILDFIIKINIFDYIYCS